MLAKIAHITMMVIFQQHWICRYLIFLFILLYFCIAGIQTPNGIEIEGPSNELYLQIPYVSNIILGR